MKKLFLASTMLIGFLVIPARAEAAMLIGALGTAVAGELTTSTVVSAIIGIGARYLLSSILAPDAPKPRGTKMEMSNGAEEAPKFIQGTYGTPGHLLYHNSYSNARNIYVMVAILSTLEVRGLSNLVTICGEDEEIDIDHPDADGFCPIKGYQKNDRNYCDVKFHAGGQTEADPWLVETFKDDPDWAWKSDMICRGCAYVIVRSLFSRKGVWAGNPEFMWGLEGIWNYDPRLDSSVPGGSGPHRWDNPATWKLADIGGNDNPHIQKYNIIRGIRDCDGKWFWGGDAEAYRLPLDYVFAAANAADEDIQKKNGDHIKRWRTGMEISVDQQPIDVIREIDRCCACYTTEFGGTYKFFDSRPGLSVMTITDEDFFVTEKQSDDPFRSPEETYNTAVATFPDPKAGWVMDTAPQYQDADYLAEDGGQAQMLDVQLAYATEHNQVQRVLRATIKDHRAQLSHKGVLPPICSILEPHDRISYISKREGYGGSGVDFLIGTKDDTENVAPLVSIRSINPDAHIWLKEMELDHTVGRSKPIRRGTLDLPIDVSPDWTETENGKDKPAIRASWAWADIDLDVDKVLWRVRRKGTTKIIAHGTIHDLEDGEYLITSAALRFGKDYQVQFYLQPISSRDAAWGAWQNVTTVDFAAPLKPTLTAKSFLAHDGTLDYWLYIDWPSVAGEVTYKIEVTETHNDEDDDDYNLYSAEVSKKKLRIRDSGHFSVRVAVKAADGGTRGPWSEAETIVINRNTVAPAQPTGFTAEGLHRRIKIEAEPHPARNFKRWIAHYATENDFTKATHEKHSHNDRFPIDNLGNNKDYWIWLSAEDKDDNESPKWPAGNNNGVHVKTKRIVKDDVDLPELASGLQPYMDLGIGELVSDLNHAIQDEVEERIDNVTEIIADTRSLIKEVRAVGAQAMLSGITHYAQKEELRTEIVTQADADRAAFADQIDTVVSDQAALAVRTTSLEADAGTMQATITTIQTAYADADSALAEQITDLAVAAGTMASQITKVDQARVDGDTALATSITALTATVGSKASASAVSALDTRVTSAEGSISSQATAITNLNSAVGSKASSAAVSALETRTTAAEGTITTHSGQITTLSSNLAGKASASAVDTLATNVTSIDGKVTSVASALTKITAGTGDDVATGRVSMSAVATPSGYAARYAIKVKASDGGTDYTTGLYLDVKSDGTSRVVFDTDKLVIRDTSDNAKAPFRMVGGVLKLQNANIEEAEIGDLTVNTLNLASGAVTDQAIAQITGAITVDTSTTELVSVTSNHGAGAASVALFALFKNNGSTAVDGVVSFAGAAQGQLDSVNVTLQPKALTCYIFLYKNPTGTSSTFRVRFACDSGSVGITARRLISIATKR